ncbi:hypothetical protein GMMP1_880001 [Candidatus Magnetomoraceae bacterium gMMP-1]
MDLIKRKYDHNFVHNLIITFCKNKIVHNLPSYDQSYAQKWDWHRGKKMSYEQKWEWSLSALDFYSCKNLSGTDPDFFKVKLSLKSYEQKWEWYRLALDFYSCKNLSGSGTHFLESGSGPYSYEQKWEWSLSALDFYGRKFLGGSGPLNFFL